ncbi:F-type H+-transporting ATPase subunit gamma [Methylomarinovum caldicuralii]|uniref:F-type H+-transporting ATPase subunit gamma n=1 Tax=Methylomarinovum caldicuralii TaxID=438856 RepID=A0AAU9CLQ0_9GAMM|nr:F0F1 ATP synthase subunit gamma [Methylomarinovum caldicuralii]BCX82606.1 F-type H+-transporting ATPase subunit gamma [Methylomarinovum caldicuralii]
MAQTLETLQRAIELSTRLADIVRTMKVLAAVSIHQYEQAAAALSHYAHTVELGLSGVIRRGGLPRLRYREGKRAAVVFGSDQGLCGRFNENLVAFAEAALAGEARILVVGARAESALEARGVAVEECFFVPGSVAAITATVRQILEKIESWRQEGVTTVDLFHQRPHGRGRPAPVQLRLLPLEESFFRHLGRHPWPGRSLPAFSAPGPVLLGALVRQYLFVSLYRACAESLAAEHGLRLLAMQQAERNIRQHLERLQSVYQQQRQEQITAELLEVAAGFEALLQTEKTNADT